jgi:hypothetical protein
VRPKRKELVVMELNKHLVKPKYLSKNLQHKIQEDKIQILRKVEEDIASVFVGDIKGGVHDRDDQSNQNIG